MIEEPLVVEGEKKAVKEEGEGYYRSERSYGKFYRSIPLPQGAKADEIQAELTSGILKVIIPVPEVTGPSSHPDRDGKVVIGRRGHSVAL